MTALLAFVAVVLLLIAMAGTPHAPTWYERWGTYDR